MLYCMCSIDFISDTSWLPYWGIFVYLRCVMFALDICKMSRDEHDVKVVPSVLLHLGRSLYIRCLTAFLGQIISYSCHFVSYRVMRDIIWTGRSCTKLPVSHRRTPGRTSSTAWSSWGEYNQISNWESPECCSAPCSPSDSSCSWARV